MLDIKLEAYANSDYYPFHMPGHKRNFFSMTNPYAIDITEIEGFDNLHDANGVIKEAQERAAEVYGSKKSYYLVNGSTCGILAAVSAAVRPGEKLLMARNAHKSTYHAAYLRHLSAVYLNPCMTEFGISGAVAPEEVRQKLKENPDTKAVIITSPTYEGIVSDVKAIAEIVHKYKIPLIVDEAHGAHFGFHRAFPQTAVRLHADIVIQSMHKVLPSLTQTALLHLNSDYVSAHEIEKYLDIYETSSPSYVLMAGMEKCIRFLQVNGAEYFGNYVKLLSDFYKNTETLRNIHVMGKQDFTETEIFDLDLSKIVISAENTNISGEILYRQLLHEYHLQMEMFSGFYVLGMTSIMDTETGFLRLSQALKETDESIAHIRKKTQDEKKELIRSLYEPKEKRMEIHEAMELPAKEVSFDEAEGKISGCMVCLYPPGIPLLLPGEAIDFHFIKNIRKCLKYRLNLQGIADIINEKINIVNF